MAKHKFIVRYQSGTEIRFRADELSVKRNVATGVVTEVTWKNIQPVPLMIGLNHIESVWQVK